jgi:hypothetical protein
MPDSPPRAQAAASLSTGSVAPRVAFRPALAYGIGMTRAAGAHAALLANLDAAIPVHARALLEPGAVAFAWTAGLLDTGVEVVHLVYALGAGPAMAGVLNGIPPDLVSASDLPQVRRLEIPIGGHHPPVPAPPCPAGPDTLRGAALKALAGACDAEAIDLLLGLGLHGGDVYGWMTHPGRRSRAMAFARRHPWLAPRAAAMGEGLDPFLGDPDAAAARLVSGIAEEGDVAGLAARMRGFALPEEMEADGFDEAVAALAILPPGAFPAPLTEDDAPSGDAQQGYLALFTLAADVVRLADLSGRTPACVLGRAAGWRDYVSALARRAGLGESPDDHPGQWGWVLPDDVTHAVSEMVERFSGEVLRPALRLVGPAAESQSLPEGMRLREIPQGSLAEASARLLLGRRTLPALAEVSGRWHARSDAIARLLADLAGDAAPAGPFLFPDTDLGDGHYVTCLRTARDLIAEGAPGRDAAGVRGLDHCVGGYAEAVALGRTAIVSLRRRANGGWTRISTAQVHFRTDATGNDPHVAQHRGRSNAPPGPDAEALLRRALSIVAESAGRELALHLSAGPRPFDWSGAVARPGAWEALRDAWAFALPRPLRAAGPAGLLEASGYLRTSALRVA